MGRCGGWKQGSDSCTQVMHNLAKLEEAVVHKPEVDALRPSSGSVGLLRSSERASVGTYLLRGWSR